jgi:asparagine synthase (glutamine-hydrolysing)
MVSDVPLGAFLSGGIDSSSIVAFMSQMSSQPVQTFSIGFEDDTYNELPDAQVAADHFGAQHRTQILNSDITGLTEKLVYHLDEPMADFSIFPTFLVSQLASQSVKVVLSGDGGDELFAGYDTYIAESLSRYYQWLPRGLRQNAIPSLVKRIPPQPAKKGFINKTKRMVEGGALEPSLHHARWMIFLSNGEKASLYHPDLRGTLNGYSTNSIFEGYFNDAALFDPLAQQQYVDIKTYLPDDILAKVDRMSMAASIEARVPLLRLSYCGVCSEPSTRNEASSFPDESNLAPCNAEAAAGDCSYQTKARLQHPHEALVEIFSQTDDAGSSLRRMCPAERLLQPSHGISLGARALRWPRKS